MRIPSILLAALFLIFDAALRAEDAAALAPLKEGATFAARDTLDCGKETQADAQACLDGLKWERADFSVRFDTPKPGNGEWLVRFPTPRPSGDATNDLVAMEWLMARDDAGQPKKAPAVVVVHESGRGMQAGRAIARGLRNSGIHTFLIHLPGYGARTSEFTRDMSKMLPGLKQAVADVRRARDAVSVLPYVDKSLIAVQGTSLGGFVVATVSGLDHGYDKCFILLAGGQIAEVLLNGKRDAANMRRRLEAVGVNEQQIREFAQTIEPMRLAHRVDPARTWLFCGRFDDVVPPECSEAFAKAAKLRTENHFIFPVGHYSAALLLPAILPKVSEIMRQKKN